MLASPTSLFSFLATVAILANEAQALPTRRSTSHLSRRAQRPKGLRRSPDGLSFSGRAKRTTTGDHSIIVDASASTSTDPSSSAGGIKNSTINLTVISKREAEHSSIFARVVRSLFGGSSEPLTAAPIVEKRRPSPAAVHPSSHQGTRRHAKAGKALREKRSKPAARKVERALEERAGLYQTDLSEQQSIYRAAVAALNDPTATSSSTEAFSTNAAPVVNAVVSGSAVSSSVVVDATATSSPIANPKSTLLAASSPSAPASAASPSATDASLEPITLTMTLIPAGPGGAYIDQAALPSSSTSADPIVSASPSPRSASSSAEFASTTAGSAPASFRKARRSPNQVAARAVHAHAEKREWVKVAHF
ncbi:hypothetical protein BCR35DRAFT_351018 [Leucosporidium creatinivorum]|uniref:Uncharacterized protein n=1 Tax=Leucosporidium creatinivorum TaxID=106004 RepID=A0A1Y2FWU9_9BASI|nr:hypothetical protein BCR35DRAFT_351018 [Leucosporidium creatinivorum]